MLRNEVDKKLGITKKDELVTVDTKQAGITWKAGSAGESIWMGRIEVEPNAKSGGLHHEKADMVHYILDGEATFFYGEDFEKSAQLNKGDFIYIPPYGTYKFQNNNDSDQLHIIVTMAPFFQIIYLDENESAVFLSTEAYKTEIKVVKAAELTNQTDQTKNMPRRTAVQASNLWIGRVTGEADMDSGAHHHGEAETAGFIISGQTQLLYGEGYEKIEEYTPEDFLRVPSFAPHIERNPSKTEPIEFLTARNPKNIVVNLE